MLSVEKNPPRDPSKISQLKSISSSNSSRNSSDEKGGSDDQQQQLQIVDLLKSDQDDRFSIRDYVFETRGKDIKNNWPFSQKNLQRCLKHGVTNLLPPFQSSDVLRNPSLESCKTNSLLSEKENTGNLNGEPSGQGDHVVFVDSNNAGCHPKLAEDCSNTNPGGSDGDKELPSTTTSQSCSGIDSVVTNKSPILEPETDILPELTVAKAKVASSASNKTEIATQAPVKKCRLIVKLSNIANSSTKEDTAANNFMVSEAMASKVCPVCKTFSSSSNTTLNAHIDQCLSGGSTTKWTTDSKVTKHRIKPRKMKSMVDILATARHCTLEELDQRNGTNWATNSILPSQEFEASADQKKEGSSPANLEETSDEGAVYIDANGTKVRILSKSNDLSVFSKKDDGPQPKKSIDRDKVTKFLSAKKRMHTHFQKQLKLLKDGKKISSSRSHHSPEIKDNQDINFSEEESRERDECMTQQVKARTEVKISRPDMIQGWACSKRTGLRKKSNVRDYHQHSAGCDNRGLPVENNQLSLGDSRVKKRCLRSRLRICDNPLSPSGSSKQIDISSHEHHEEYREQPSLRKGLGFSPMESQASHRRKRSQVLPGYPDQNVKRTRSNEHHNQDHHAPLLGKRKIKVDACLDTNADLPVVDQKVSADHHKVISKARRLSSLRKKLSAGGKSRHNSKFNLKGKILPLKKSRVHCMSESKDEAVCAVGRQHVKQNPVGDGARIERICDIESVDRTGVLKIKKGGGGSMISSRKEETMALKTSRSVSISYHHDAGNHDGSFELCSLTAGNSGVAESAGNNIHHIRAENFDIEPPSEVATERAVMNFRNSLDAGSHGLADSSDAQSDSHHFTEVHGEPPLFEAEAPTSSAEPILSGDQEMFCAAEVPEDMMRENVIVMMELDSSGGHGNYFTKVDPIPIPGPPGSFLPSPGHMDSEDLQGNSSLTSSRVQSSDGHQELVDHSSDSPVSAISTISNATLGRSDSKSSGKSSVGHPSFSDATRPGSIAAANTDPTVENASPALKPTDGGVEKISFDELKVDSTITEKDAFGLKNDHRCCCSRREGFTQNVSLNFQESQLLRRRTMVSVLVPPSEKEMTGDTERRLDILRSEMSSISSQSPGSETPTRSPKGHTMSRISADSEVKFTNRDDGESCSPSASNPVLRLMGKNLMVVKKDENISPQPKPSQFSSFAGHANPQVVSLSGVPVGNAQNDNQLIDHHVVSQGPFCYDQTERRNGVIQYPEMRWRDGFGSRENPGTPQSLPLHAILSSRGAVRGSMGSSMHYDYMAGHQLPTEECQPLNRLEPLMTCDQDKYVRIPSLWRNANTTASATKEIIVIDDTPENMADSMAVATHNEGMVQGMGSSSSVGKSMTMAAACDSRHTGTFHGYQQYKSATFGGSPADASFHMPPPSGLSGSSVKWNWAPEGSNAMRASPLVISSSSTAQQRSKLYTSSNF